MKRIEKDIAIKSEQEWRGALTPFLTYLSSKKKGINVEDFVSIGSDEDRNFINQFLQKDERFYNPCNGHYPENEAEWYKTLMQYRYKPEKNMSKAFIPEGPKTGRYKFALDYIELTSKYCLKKKLSLYHITVWLYRNEEFDEDTTISDLREKFNNEFKMSTEEIDNFFIDDMDSHSDNETFKSSGTTPVKVRENANRQIERSELAPISNKLSIGRKGFVLFKNIITESENSIRILTNRIDFDTIRTIFVNCREGTNVEIVTNVVIGDILPIKEFFKKKGVFLRLIKCKRLHAKILISDNKRVLIGSSNITHSSLGSVDDDGSMIEVNIVTMEKNVVQRADELFEIIKREKMNSNLPREISNNDLMSSVNGFPSKMEQLMRNAKQVTIIVPALMHKSILGALRMVTHERQLEIITNWPKSSSKSDRMGLHLLRGLFYKKTIKFIPLKERDRIHAKVYVFTVGNEKKIVAITSANLTHDSWHRSVETGFLTENNSIVNKIEQWVNGLRNNQDIDIIKQNISDRIPAEKELPSIEREIIETVEPKFIEGKKFKPIFEELFEEFRKKYNVSEEDDKYPLPSKTVEREIYDEDLGESIIIEDIPENVGEETDTESSEKRPENQNVSDMIYVYAAMILFYLGKEVNKENIEKIVASTGIQPDNVMLSALLSCLRNFDWNSFKDKLV